MDVATAGAVDSLAALAVIVGAIVLALIALFVLPYIFFVLELLIVPALFAYRILFRRPWTVEATAPSDRRRWKVVGWRRSGEVVEELARAIERGEINYRPSESQLVEGPS